LLKNVGEKQEKHMTFVSESFEKEEGSRLPEDPKSVSANFTLYARGCLCLDCWPHDNEGNRR
jgi:hypothetical protein